MRNGVVGLVFLALLLASAPGLAGSVVKYRTPDGKIGFASPKLVPEGATVESSDYQSSGQLTTSSRSAKADASNRKLAEFRAELLRQRVARANREERARIVWGGRARLAQRDLKVVERNYEKWMARCGDSEDHLSSSEPPPDCSADEKSHLDAALERRDEMRDWIEDGLFNACRISDECLPGYIR